MTGQTTVAPALTARAKAASGSATTTTIRTVAPPRNSAPSDSGLKFLCSGERGSHTARFSPDGVQTHPRPRIQIPPPIAGQPLLHCRSRCGTIRQLQTPGPPGGAVFAAWGGNAALWNSTAFAPVADRKHWGDRCLSHVGHGNTPVSLSVSSGIIA